MREQVRAIQGEDAQESLDRLLAHVGGGRPERWSLERFNLKNARSRVEVLALLALAPRHRAGHVSLNALVSNGRIAREVFAPRHLVGMGDEVVTLARTAANRVLLDALHTDLRSELIHWDPNQDADALASHLIDAESFAAIRARDVGTFLRRRSAALQATVERFINEHAAWNAPVIRPRASYFDEEE